MASIQQLSSAVIFRHRVGFGLCQLSHWQPDGTECQQWWHAASYGRMQGMPLKERHPSSLTRLYAELHEMVCQADD